MKLLSFLIFGFISFVSFSFAGDEHPPVAMIGEKVFQLKHDTRFEESFNLGRATTLDVQADLGDIKVESSTDDKFYIKALYKGSRKKDATLTIVEREPGKVRIVSEMPKVEAVNSTKSSKTTKSSGSVSVNGVSYPYSGGSVSIINNKVYIDGVEIHKAPININAGGYEDLSKLSFALTLLVPQNYLANLRVKNSFGDVVVSGLSDINEVSANRVVSLNTKSGKVNIEKIYAPYGIIACSQFGDVCSKHTQTINGFLSIDSASGGVSALWHYGVIAAASKFGDVEVSNVISNIGEFAVDAFSKSGEVTVTKVNGPVVANSDFGNVEVKAITGTVYAKAKSGEVVIDSVSSDVQGFSSFGNIKVTNVEGQLLAETKSGDVKLRNPNVVMEDAYTKFASVKGVSKPGKCKLALERRVPARSWNPDDIFNF